jgi:hypothetical protein
VPDVVASAEPTDIGPVPDGVTSSSAPRIDRPVTLDVGHCRIERLIVDRKGWVTKRDNIGGGGGLPDGFTPDGTFEVISPNRAVFTSTTGVRVPFKAAPTEQPPIACD